MDERDLECAEASASAERESAAARSRRAVNQGGAEDCADCGAPISPERRAAAPFARRCMACQMLFERGRIRHAV